MIRVTHGADRKAVHMHLFAMDDRKSKTQADWHGVFTVQLSVESAEHVIAQLQAAVEAVKGGDDE